MPFNSKAVKILRERESLTRQDLAKILGVSEVSVRHYENNVRKPGIKILDELYQLATQRGHEDLNFYSPKKENW